MKAFKRLLLLSAFTLTLAAPASASTIIANLGVDPTSATGSFSNSLGLSTSAFADDYLFSLNHPMALTIASATNDFPRPSDFITNFTGAVFSGTPALPGSEVLGPAAAAPCISTPTCQFLAGSAILGAGTYFLQISGIAGGSSGYGGNISTSAIPLPGTLALFAGGLGMLGWFGVRRQRSNA